jgi:hypothetical protein
VSGSLRPWLVVVPLATLGLLGGHELAYAITGTPSAGLHGYLGHLPQLVLLLVLLSLVGASFVERGQRVALWPFPAVVLATFVLQEHLERIAHHGSVPFLLDDRVFQAGLAVQAIVALAAWVLARALVRIVGAPRSVDRCAWPSAAAWVPAGRLILSSRPATGVHGARAPPPRDR